MSERRCHVQWRISFVQWGGNGESGAVGLNTID